MEFHRHSRRGYPEEVQVCTLCSTRLPTYQQVQAHLMSGGHLDMVVRNPAVSLQDVIVPEWTVHRRSPHLQGPASSRYENKSGVESNLHSEFGRSELSQFKQVCNYLSGFTSSLPRPKKYTCPGVEVVSIGRFH